MASIQGQRQQKLPLSSSDAGADDRGGDRFGLTCSVPLTVLTINSVNAIYRASANGDTPVVLFVIFVYLAYLVLDYCLTELGRSPPLDNGPRRETLKLVAWVFSTAMGFGFAYHLSPLVSPSMGVFFYALAAASSGLFFYVHFCSDRGDRGHTTSWRVEKVDVEFVFGGAKNARADAKSAGDLSAAAENV